MILIISCTINQLSNNYYKNFISSLDPSDIHCSCCDHSLHHHGSYPRSYKDIDGKRHYFNVYRLYCPSCGLTFSILPDCLFPYGTCPFQALLSLLQESKEPSDSQTCILYDISKKAALRFKKLFFGCEKAALSYLSMLHILTKDYKKRRITQIKFPHKRFRFLLQIL